MALRVKVDGRILCANFHLKEEGDIYIDDSVHEWLSNVIDKKYGYPIIGKYNEQTHEWFKLNDEEKIKEFKGD